MRTASLQRKTSETEIQLELTLDGSGRSDISSGIPFLDHMLDQMARHGLMDLTLRATGDLEVDFHHTVEDIGICLGKGIKEAMGDASGIQRFGHSVVPMDESLVSVTLDISGRPYFVYRAPETADRAGAFPVTLVPEFFRAVSVHAGLTLHIHVLDGRETHHMMEACFKSFGCALAQALAVDESVTGVPSTKGILD